MRIELIQPLTPPSSVRAWASAPHPTKDLLAAASSDKTVRLYSLSSFKQVGSIGGGHKRSIRSCAWKPGSGDRSGWSVLATGSFDASAGIWKREEGGGYAVGNNLRGDDDYDDGGEDAASGMRGDNLDFEFSLILEGHDSEIKSVAWSPSGTQLATCSRDKSVWVWEEIEEDNFETIAVLQDHDGDVKSVAWHPTEVLLASGSYDDTIRLYREDIDDWTSVAVLNGHTSTVWWVEFEGAQQASLEALSKQSETLSDEQKEYISTRRTAGARLVSTSDDQTIRIWRRISTNSPAAASAVPSILRSQSIEEEWEQEIVLPKVHDRAIYTAAWSSKSGLIASSGSDGRLVVYQERWKSTKGEGAAQLASQAEETAGSQVPEPVSLTEWVVVAEIEAAHDVFEVNHACWAKRWDKGKRSEDEEMILTTGDDGEVKAWSIEE